MRMTRIRVSSDISKLLPPSGARQTIRSIQMFKKSMAALAVLSLSAGLASASEVTLYGIVDNGLLYKHSKVETNGVSTKTDSFALESGISSPSRFGIKGSEDLGNGMKVSFQLENGFKADSGEFKTSGGKLFDRQATVALSSDFGTLTMGRVGGVGSGAGFDLVYGYGDAFDGGSGDVLGLLQSARYDNMVTYQTPKFAGLQATVQYSFNEDSVEETAREGSSAVNRYSSAALTGDFGALQTVLAYEFQNYKSFGAAEHEDGQIVYLGGNYDCGFAKTFIMGQYFKGIKAGQLTAISDADAKEVDTASSQYYSADGVKGYGVHLGTIVPVAGGDLTVAAYFTDFAVEYADQDVDAKSYAFGAKYEYYLSKRTSVYTGAGFAQVKYDDDGSDKTTQAYLGLTHRF